jgi:hypothetical protein
MSTCTSITASPSRSSSKSPLVAWKTTACYGTCPVYDIVVYDDMSSVYHGRAFVEHMGKRAIHFTTADLKPALDHIVSMHFFDMPREFDSRLTDVPTTYVRVYRRDGTFHEVRARADLPTAMQTLLRMLRKLVGPLIGNGHTSDDELTRLGRNTNGDGNEDGGGGEGEGGGATRKRRRIAPTAAGPSPPVGELAPSRSSNVPTMQEVERRIELRASKLDLRSDAAKNLWRKINPLTFRVRATRYSGPLAVVANSPDDTRRERDDDTIMSPQDDIDEQTRLIEGELSRLYYTVTYDAIEVRPSSISGRGVFVRQGHRLKRFDAVPLFGTHVSTELYAQLSKNNMDQYVHAVPDGKLDGNPSLFSWNNTAHRGMSIGSILNEPMAGTFPNCVFIGGFLVVVGEVGAGVELTVHYGTQYERTYEVGFELPKAYDTLFK